MKDSRMTVRLPKGLRAQILTVAERYGITSSAWAVNALRSAIAREQEEQAARGEGV